MANDVLKTLIAEAYGEGPEGMRRVAETIINRAAIRGLTPEQVVNQPYQYTGLTQPGPSAVQAWNDPKAIAAAQAAWELAQKPGDPTKGADHYYAPGTIAEPYWAKSMTPTGAYGGHAFFSSRPVPPGEIPNVVATKTDVVPPPAPVPVTQSPDIALMRNPVMSISAARASAPPPMPRPRPSNTPMSASDSLALNPVRDMAVPNMNAGVYTGPAFNAAYPLNGSSNFASSGAVPYSMPKIAPIPASAEERITARNKASSPTPGPLPPIPAVQSAHLAARRATDPALQAALNARYPVMLPPLPSAPPQPDRLAPSSPFPPANFGTMTPVQVAQIGVGLGAPPPMPGKIAPVPFPPYRQVATATSIPPMPRPRPYAPARPPLEILVQGSNTAPARRMTPVQALQGQGMGSAQAYSMANAQAQQQAIANSKNPEGNSRRAALAAAFGFD